MGPIIWVEGIIGSGKSTLTKTIAERLNLKAFHEPVESNPFLDRFYKDPERWAFPMQMYLMYQRFAMQKEAAYAAARGNGAVLDRGMPGDRVFCKLHMLEGNIHKLEWMAYQASYDIMACSLTPPSLLLFLDVEPDVALERVRARARGVESSIDLRYLVDLRKGYLDLLCEVESGSHAWAQGMEVMRLAWNTDHLPVEPLICELSHKLRLDTKPPQPAQ